MNQNMAANCGCCAVASSQVPMCEDASDWRPELPEKLLKRRLYENAKQRLQSPPKGFPEGFSSVIRSALDAEGGVKEHNVVWLYYILLNIHKGQEPNLYLPGDWEVQADLLSILEFTIAPEADRHNNRLVIYDITLRQERPQRSKSSWTGKSAAYFSVSSGKSSRRHLSGRGFSPVVRSAVRTI